MEKKPIWLTLCVVAIWAAVAVTGIFAPNLDAGGTIIPIGAILAPIFGAIATGFLTIWAVSA